MTTSVVIAIGGNSLIKDAAHQEINDQLLAAKETVERIADVIELGYEVIITHGNGPQVGFILRRSELAFEAGELHFVPLKNCVADTQGAIGYQLQESLVNTFRRRKMDRTPCSLVTMVEVDGDDPSFMNPTKPIGVFYPGDKVASLQKAHPDWILVHHQGKGYQRVVPSPKPLRIVEMDAIQAMMKNGLVVIAGGGGGIPVVRDESGDLSGVNAVVDKDLTSALLASGLQADLLMISTPVENVYQDFQKPTAAPLGTITPSQAKALMAQGEFGEGTMQPKIEAALNFLARGGKRVIITNPKNLVAAIKENKGTHIVPEAALK